MGEKQVVGGSQLPVCPGLHGVASVEIKRGLSYFDTRSKTARTLQQAEAPTAKMTSNEVLAQRIEALVREHILVLFARRVADRHDALGEEIAAFALRAERSFSPENESPKLTLAVVVGWVDVVALTKVKSASR